MVSRIKKIVVAGDVTLDWLMWRVMPEDPVDQQGKMPLNWQLSCGTRMAVRPGGALLLANLIREAVSNEAVVIAPGLPPHLESIGPEEIVHSLVLLEKYGDPDLKVEERMTYRVKENLGYAGPQLGRASSRLKVEKDDADAGLVVLDDAGNGFRDDEEAWPLAIKTPGKKPLVILKASRPLMSGKLWEQLTRDHADRLVVVISANDLRAQEVNISRRLSWERTATDFFWQLTSNRSLVPLAACRHLLVRFGLDCAIHYSSSGGEPEAVLYYDPARLEGGFMDEYQGGMTGLGIAFVAALTAQVAGDGLENLGEGVLQGILSARRLLQLGFGGDQKRLNYPGKQIFQPLTQKEPLIATTPLPSPAGLHCADPDYWTILKDLTRANLEEVAFNTVITGKDGKLDRVPLARFGKLQALDRREIESLRSIENLLREYLQKAHRERPLSLAVFGPPGAGKSFTVTQVAKNLAPGLIERVECNLSQWDSPGDLIKALHRVRDVVLKGQVPLVFLDEFDARLQGEELGWLKYFLEPMQDGRFKEGESVHPIGRAIFVFAGGTSTSFQEFSREGQAEEEIQRFKKAKGTDFVSRLRGYVDVKGINPTDKDDRLYKLRRAVILRNMLLDKAAHLFDRNGQLQIQEGVLYALLSTSHYKHGARSLEAVLDMSMLAGRRSFEQAALPPAEQLALHVEAEEFCKMVNRDVLLGSRREKLAEAIHEEYRKDQEGKRDPAHPAMQPWEELREDYRESNRQQADHLPVKLRAIGYGFRPIIGRKPILQEFSPGEIEKLAKIEHDRYLAERLANGWIPGPDDPGKKTNPTLKGWEELEEEEKEKDRMAVRRIPGLMAQAGFELYQLEEQ